MPASIAISALFFIVLGAGAIVAFPAYPFLLWPGAAALAAGGGLLFRQRWSRSLGSAVIIAGYAGCGIFLMFHSGPRQHSGTWLAYVGALLAVALLTALFGNLWGRSASAFLAPRK